MSWKRNNVEVFIMAALGLFFILVFAYTPMFGIILAFKDADNVLDVLGAMFNGPWAEKSGFDHFIRFLTDIDFKDVMINTICYNLLNLIITLPVPLIYSILFTQISFKKPVKICQIILFLPHFISSVVYTGIVWALLDDGYGGGIGPVNALIQALGGQKINFKASPNFIWAIMIIAEILKSSAWASLIYVAAISGIDPQLYEAATIDGASKFKQATYIIIPLIMPMFSLSLITSLSGILNNDAGSMLLWQTQLNLSRTEVLGTYILKYGINNMQYSYATAIGLFKSIVSLALILTSNWVTKKISGEGVIF